MIRGHRYLENRVASILKIPRGSDRDAAKARLHADLENELRQVNAKVAKLETDLERAKLRVEGEVSVFELCERQNIIARKATDLEEAKRDVAQLEGYLSLSEQSFAFADGKHWTG